MEGIVKIHGKDYQTVAYRVARFREKYPNHQIYTELIKCDDQVVIIRCDICDAAGVHVASGHAEEYRASSQINKTSALENAESSAVGRALGFFGIAGTEFPSIATADEVQNAIHQQNVKPIRKVRSKEELESLINGIKSEAELRILWGALLKEERDLVKDLVGTIGKQLKGAANA